MQPQYPMNRRAFLRNAAISVVGLSLVACAPAAVPSAPAAESGGAASEQPAADQATLLFMSQTINDGHITVRDKWSQEFMEANPNVTVDHQTVPQEYTTKIQTLFAAGTPADIYRYLAASTDQDVYAEILADNTPSIKACLGAGYTIARTAPLRQQLRSQH